MHLTLLALSTAPRIAGMRRAASMAMMASTTSNSISVKARRLRVFMVYLYAALAVAFRLI